MKSIKILLVLCMVIVTLSGCKEEGKEEGNKENTNYSDDIYRVQSGKKAYDIVNSGGDISSVCEEEFIDEVNEILKTKSSVESNGYEVIYVYNNYGVNRLQLDEKGIICGVIEYGTVY